MRIACVHVPQFALQCATRVDPTLRAVGAPIAIVGTAVAAKGAMRDADADLGRAGRSRAGGPVVQACSRAAWALGVRVGMAASAVRGVTSPAGTGRDLRVVTGDPQLERDGARAIADTLLGLSAVVDVGGRVGANGAHLAMYCEVPSKTRGVSFGERLLERLEQLGISARIGIADDRFTAWVAASQGADARTDDLVHRVHHLSMAVVSVPRGGSAAFLAPRPLSLLAISPEVQHMLEALGVRTLGEFAALPAPSVARPLEADYQALARGDSGHALRPYSPDAPIREEAVITSSLLRDPPETGVAIASQLSGPAAVAMVAGRIALRLVGRARGAARLEVTLASEAGERVVPIAPLAARSGERRGDPGRVLESAEDLADAIGSAAEDLGAVWRLRVVVTGEAIVGDAVGEAVSSPSGAIAAAASAAPIGAADAVSAGAGSPGEAPPAGADLDALSVVLATTGSWHLTPSSSSRALLRDERRDGHRRTQRGKQRARQGRERRSSAAEPPVQPRLFKNLV